MLSAVALTDVRLLSGTPLPSSASAAAAPCGGTANALAFARCVLGFMRACTLNVARDSVSRSCADT